MRLIDDQGREMDAEYLVETDGQHLALIMESRSGRSGNRTERNPDYNPALAVLLTRLGKLNAVLADALVDSRYTQDLGLPEADRSFIEEPIRLAQEPDADALRRRLGTAQAKIAQAPDATKGGNATKRIRLRIEVPGFLPGDAALLAQTLAAPVAGGVDRKTGYSPVEQAEEAVKNAAGKGRRQGQGQGFQLDQDAKTAVEDLAMEAAAKFYSTDWDVEDVHGTESYDLICRRGDEVRHVEVKGTTTDGAEVLLTPNEVRHARENPCTVLFILSNITLERAEDGTVMATGGKQTLYDPWRVDDGTLTPVGFRYQVPGMEAEA
jgi:Domain of unknown function (DUF3883)